MDYARSGVCMGGPRGQKRGGNYVTQKNLKIENK